MMAPPGFVMIGDSIIAGHPVNFALIEAVRTISLSSTIAVRLGALSGQAYQNLGIEGQTTTQIAGRFAKDVVGLAPRYCVIEGGVNDIARSGRESTFLTNGSTMLQTCKTAGIVPVVLLMTPWTAGTNAQNQARVQWNADLTALCKASYPTAVVVEVAPAVGQYRAGGDPGNLWDQQPASDAGDHVHFNAAGYGVISQAIFEAMK